MYNKTHKLLQKLKCQVKQLFLITKGHCLLGFMFVYV
jgi:hypothetical protein